MSSSSPVAATRVVDDDDSDISNCDEIIEVEEVEVEEYEDVDDLSDSQQDVSEDRNDAIKELESKKHLSHLESCSSTREKSKVRPSSDALIVEASRGNCGSSNGPLIRKNEVICENHEESKYVKSRKHLTLAEDNGSQDYEISKKDLGAFPPVKTLKEQTELHIDGGVHFCNGLIADTKTTSPTNVTRKNVGGSIGIKRRLDEGTSEEEIKLVDTHSGDDKQRTESRFASPATRTRNLSPGAEILDGNKRPAVICNFFTKGWCIKGNSCRFLHVKDDMNNMTELLEEDVAAASVKTETQFDEERIMTQEPEETKRLPQFQENRMFSMLRKENTTFDISPSSQGLASLREDIGFILSSKDAERESLRQSWPAADNGNCASLINKGSSPIFKNNLLPEYRTSSSGSAILSSNYHGKNPSAYPSNLEERPLFQSKYMHNDYASPVLSHTMNSSLGASGPTSSSFPSHHISAMTGSSLPFYSSSLNASSRDAKKLLESDRECRNSRLALFLGSTSPFSCSEPEKPQIDKTKISPNDWEPSVPFQPSFFVAPTDMSSPGSQYDPLRDSFDTPKIGHAPLKFAFSSSDKNCITPRKDSHSDNEEGVGTSIVEEQNGALPNENGPSIFSYVKDVSKLKKIDSNCDSRIHNVGCRHKKEEEREIQSNEMDRKQKVDGDVRKESKLTKHFRTGLVDFVKELLKPTWREGRLSKDAHNTIVKKAVEKVLSTLQPHQIPTTVESIKQYLSSSQPKIAKLVEGYVDKYGKS